MSGTDQAIIAWVPTPRAFTVANVSSTGSGQGEGLYGSLGAAVSMIGRSREAARRSCRHRAR